MALRLKEHQAACLERAGLSAPQANALWRMDEEGSVSVGALADRCRIDPSNLTGPLDGLEERGLVERRAAEHDRRVRSVSLTPAGVEARRELMDCLFDEPPVAAGLAASERETLRDLLARLVG